MAITDKIVTKERLQYFKGKLDANGYKNVIEKIKVNGTSQSVNTTDKSVNLFLPTWDFDHGATSYSKSVALALRTEDGQGTRKAMALSIDSAADPQKVMVGVWGNLDTEMYHAEVPTIAAMNEAIEAGGGKIDKIKVNGVEQTITNKEVDIEVPSVGVRSNGCSSVLKNKPSDQNSFDIEITGIDADKNAGSLIIRATDENGVRVASFNASSDALIEEWITENVPVVTHLTSDNLVTIQTNVSGSPVTSSVTTPAYVNGAINTALSSISGVDFQIVANISLLPATGTKGVFYLVPNTGSGQNVYDEYVWVNKGTTENPNYAYEMIGTTAVDLSGYVQEDDLVEITTAEIDAMFA